MTLEQDTATASPGAGADPFAAIDASLGAVYDKAGAAEASEPSGEEDRTETARDAGGRFAKKDAPEAEAPDDATTTPSEADKPANEPGLEPPATWSAAAKTKWATIPRELQDEILKREGDVARGFEQKAKETKRYSALEEVIAPVRDKWARAGMDEASAIRSLVAAQNALEQNPREALAWLARQYGVNPAEIASQPAAQNEPARAAQTDPEIASLRTGLAELYAQQANAEIAAFAKDRPYFDDLRQDMHALMRAGLAADLGEAYEQAKWRNAAVRERILTDQRKADEARRAAAAAEAKRVASVNVRGKSAAAPAAAADWTKTVSEVGNRLLG